MKQWTQKEFFTVLKNNGYTLDRRNGSHCIFTGCNTHISVPKSMNATIIRRLIKENNLQI